MTKDIKSKYLKAMKLSSVINFTDSLDTKDIKKILEYSYHNDICFEILFDICFYCDIKKFKLVFQGEDFTRIKNIFPHIVSDNDHNILEIHLTSIEIYNFINLPDNKRSGFTIKFIKNNVIANNLLSNEIISGINDDCTKFDKLIRNISKIPNKTYIDYIMRFGNKGIENMLMMPTYFDGSSNLINSKQIRYGQNEIYENENKIYNRSSYLEPPIDNNIKQNRKFNTTKNEEEKVLYNSNAENDNNTNNNSDDTNNEDENENNSDDTNNEDENENNENEDENNENENNEDENENNSDDTNNEDENENNENEDENNSSSSRKKNNSEENIESFDDKEIKNFGSDSDSDSDEINRPWKPIK